MHIISYNLGNYQAFSGTHYVHWRWEELNSSKNNFSPHPHTVQLAVSAFPLAMILFLLNSALLYCAFVGKMASMESLFWLDHSLTCFTNRLASRYFHSGLNQGSSDFVPTSFFFLHCSFSVDGAVLFF